MNDPAGCAPNGEYENLTQLCSQLQSHIHHLFHQHLLDVLGKNERIARLYDIVRKINLASLNDIRVSSPADASICDTTLIPLRLRPDYAASWHAATLPTKTPVFTGPLATLEDIQHLCKDTGFPCVHTGLRLLQIDATQLGHKDRRLLSFYDEMFATIGYDMVETSPRGMPAVVSNNAHFNSKHVYVLSNIERPREELLGNNYCLHVVVGKTHVRFYGFFREDALQMRSRLVAGKHNDDVLMHRRRVMASVGDSCAFSSRYARYAKIHELITKPVDAFCDYVRDRYQRYLELNNKPFPELMKEFLNRGNGVYGLFETINLLLHGNDDAVSTAGSLFSLLRERRCNAQLTSDLIYNNLSFAHQLKLNVATTSLKNEMDKLTEVSVESTADLRKQLLLNKRIPASAKALALEKLNEMKLNTNDYYKQLTYVRTVLAFPWGTEGTASTNPSPSRLSRTCALASSLPRSMSSPVFEAAKDPTSFLATLEKNLDATTYGQRSVKEEVLVHACKWVTNPDSAGTSLALVGPPGVGKTLIAKSLGQSLGVPFVQINLGGQNDGELLHGHGYTYAGAQPGVIVKKMCEAGQPRCVMYFDELDKSCAKHGTTNEITSILIHLTDPNVHKAFQDRFFQGVDFPLDQVIFIFSYNDRNRIDPILLDRLIEVELKPYCLNDKVAIARRYLIPQLCRAIGLSRSLTIHDDTLRTLILDYTNEAGVRDLKHKLEGVLLRINRDIVMNTLAPTDDIVINQDILRSCLSSADVNTCRTIARSDGIGIVNGLFASANGGGGITAVQVAPIFTARADSDSCIQVTGLLGDVMRESVKVALTAASTFLHEKGFDIDAVMPRHGLHVHFPAGSVPKDGPSAGCAIAVAIVSLLTKRAFKRTCALTGEIDLCRNVSRIGGLEYKLAGAMRAGIKTVVLPSENSTDLEKIFRDAPELKAHGPECRLVSTLDEIMEITLV